MNSSDKLLFFLPDVPPTLRLHEGGEEHSGNGVFSEGIASTISYFPNTCMKSQSKAYKAVVPNALFHM